VLAPIAGAAQVTVGEVPTPVVAVSSERPAICTSRTGEIAGAMTTLPADGAIGTAATTIADSDPIAPGVGIGTGNA